MRPPAIIIKDGGAHRRGASFDGDGVHFSVYSAHATKIELCLFDETGQTETARLALPGRTGDVWHGYVPGLKPGQVYGLRAHGPWDLANGHRFNPNKLLLDPYAREIAGEMRWTPAVSDPARDSAPDVPKARVAENLPPPRHPKPRRPMEDTVIYEAHPKGQTITDPRVPEGLRGTIAGLAHPAAAGYLSGLGVTAVELMPVHAKLHDGWLLDAGRKNYWGYNTLGFFALTPEYLKTGKREEFRDFVETMHERGIEVILDVVYNHTAEGNHMGPTLSFRGLDNASYYKLVPHDRQYYMDETGCGNTLDFNHPEVRRMTLDSLRYWAEEMGVDGFRFDLAPILGKTPEGFSPDAPFFKEIAADPVLSQLKLIAEPWGPQDYVAGRFPQGWSEWNDGFRDDIRRFWRGDGALEGAKAVRLAGSHPDLDPTGRPPSASVNIITCHDGMTLHDVVSHSHKKNHANGEGNRDGHNANHSHGHGAEGETADPGIRALRERQKRNMLASLFLSQGTPMLLAGDEHGNTQHGNNNAYCQDNEIGWLNWDRVGDEGKALAGFTKKLIALRKAHPVLSHTEHMHGNNFCGHGARDIAWIDPSGREKTHWNGYSGSCFGLMLNETAANGKKDGAQLLAVFNNNAQSINFTMPASPCGGGWEKVLDTAVPDAAASGNRLPAGTVYPAEGRSVAVFRLRR